LPAAQGSAAYGALLTEKSRIEADIKSNSDQYTDKHPKMIQFAQSVGGDQSPDQPHGDADRDRRALSLTPEGHDLIAMRRDLRRTEADLEVTRMRLERRNQQLGKMPAGDERVPV